MQPGSYVQTDKQQQHIARRGGPTTLRRQMEACKGWADIQQPVLYSSQQEAVFPTREEEAPNSRGAARHGPLSASSRLQPAGSSGGAA